MALTGKQTQGPVTITFAKSANDATFYTVSLRNVIPTSITQSNDLGPGKITETIALNATRFEFTFTPQLPNGGVGGQIKFGFDCATTTKF
jgi:hypothetical protein